MMYTVLHARKIKSAGGLSAVVKHNARTGIYAADGSLLEEPEWLTQPQLRLNNQLNLSDASTVFERRAKRVQCLEKKPRSDAAAAVEIVYSASPEWFEKASSDQIDSYFSECLAWNKRRFGAENVLHTAIHFDEKTPHLHVIMLPITRLKRQKNKLVETSTERYSSGSFLGGRDGLVKMQTDFAKEVGEGWGLERGIEGSKARHTNHVGWAKKLADDERNIGERERNIKKREAELADKQSHFNDMKIMEKANLQRTHARNKRELEVKQKKLESDYKRVCEQRDTINADIVAREEKLRAREAEVESVAGIRTTNSHRAVIREALAVLERAYVDKHTQTKAVQDFVHIGKIRDTQQKVIQQFDRINAERKANERNSGMEW